MKKPPPDFKDLQIKCPAKADWRCTETNCVCINYLCPRIEKEKA